jgi:hypothetical protein
MPRQRERVPRHQLPRVDKSDHDGVEDRGRRLPEQLRALPRAAARARAVALRVLLHSRQQRRTPLGKRRRRHQPVADFGHRTHGT